MGFVFIRDRKTRKVVTMFSDCYEKLWQKKYLVALFFFSRSTTVSWWMMFVIWGEEYCEDSFLGSAIFTFTHCFLSSCKSTPSFPSWNTFPWSQVQKWEIGSSDLSSRLKKLLEMLCVFVSIWFFQRGGIWLGRNDCGGLDYWGWKDSWCSGLNLWGNGGILRNFNIQEAWWLLLIVWWGQWAGHSKWIEVVRALDLRGKQRLSRKKSSIAPHAACRVLEYFF